MLRTALVVSLFSSFALAPSISEARSFRVNQVPNGSQFGCALCHNDPEGGGARNGFGSQVEGALVGEVTSMADVDWAAIYDQDGDSDGYSNGQELGDPDGTWTIGAPNPGGDTYAPFDRNDSPCGDGVLENPPEECDGDQLPEDVTCETLGYGPGTLSCSSRCRINPEQCEGYEVPNNGTEPPANNTNSSTNNATNGAGTNNTTGETTGTTSGSEDETPDDEGGCSTASSGSSLGFWFVLAMILRRRRR